MSNVTGLDVAKSAAKAADEKKAKRMVLLDLRGRSDICDYQLICSGENDRQTRAIADGVEKICQETLGLKPVAIEGKQSGHWILLDYGPTIINIFYNNLRDYYALEEIWPDAKFLNVRNLS